MASMTYKVELDVSGGSFGSAFSATDVTSKAVAGLGFPAYTVTWGRQDQYSAVNPTTVEGELLNTDGTFTPGNASGTYYPRIRRNLRRRVSVGVNATTVRVSDDYATALEVVPASAQPATTNISGTDILGRFGATPSTSDLSAPSVGMELRSFIAEEAQLDTPSSLYMLQEAAESTTFADVTGQCPTLGIVNSKNGSLGTITAGVNPTHAFQGGTMVQFAQPTYGTSTLGGSWLATYSLPSLTVNTFECWVEMPTTLPAAGQLGAIAYLTNSIRTLSFYIDEFGFLHFGNATTSVGGYNDGKVHHLLGTVSGGVDTLYVDGVAMPTTGPDTGITGVTTMTLGMLSVPAAPTTGLNPWSGKIAYVATYSTVLSGTRITAHYQSGATAFAGERTDQRVTRLLSYRPNTGTTLDTGAGTIGTQSIAGRSLQECLLEVAQVESGVIYIDGLGSLTFRSRTRLFNPTATVTLALTAGGVDFGSNWREDTQGVVNDVTITNESTGSDQRFYDAASVTTDGSYSTTLSLPFNADTDAMNLAGWTVVNGKQQQLAATPLIIDLLHLTNAQAQAVLSLRPLDCVQLTNLPAPAPASTMNFIVQGGVTSLASDAATVTLNVTPMPYPVAVWDSTNWDATTATWSF